LATRTTEKLSLVIEEYFFMNSKGLIGFSIAILTIMWMLYIYYVKEERLSAKLPRCFPTGEMFPYKDAYGRIVYDSVYHTIADFKLLDQNGHMVTNQTVKDKIYVANFFFCSCPSICPKMTNQMLTLQDEFKHEPTLMYLSHTINPEHDSIPILKEYEMRYGIDGTRWKLVTGSRKHLYELSRESYYLGVMNDSPDSFSHSEKLVLVDNHRVIRGYYDGTNSLEIAKLKKDIRKLLVEVRREQFQRIAND
jgi:protein SCO1